MVFGNNNRNRGCYAPRSFNGITSIAEAASEAELGVEGKSMCDVHSSGVGEDKVVSGMCINAYPEV